MTALDFAPAIALLPLASFVIALVAGAVAPNVLPKRGAIPGIVATGAALVLSAWVALTVAGGETRQDTLYTWAATSDLELNFGVLFDPLSAMMLVVVSLVAFLVHVFSLEYMNAEGETGLHRYYASLGLFTFSMLAFVMADGILMAFMFFELVGLCSFLLIGFWFRERPPASAAKKAFLVTRFGDYFFLIGVVAILVTFLPETTTPGLFFGEEGFPALAEAALAGEADVNTFGFDEATWFSIIGLLVLGGVIGKSAQFPLHTWLPDAMEGPTTVSALIHAATMVAAGVYLVARMFGYYALLPEVLAVIALVGGFTALFAATMGAVKDEIKQVLAYSTISQYGYMMLGLGVGAYVAGTFHLMTHAYFKALLFLGAGAVIVATHHAHDMWKMGGLKERMPVTYYTFLAGALALAGIVPFSGFWSKDEVLFEALVHGLGTDGTLGSLFILAFAMGLLAVFLTGFYTFRMVILTFHGEPRTDQAAEAHSVGWAMKFPLIVLGVLAAGAGLINMKPLGVTYFEDWLAGEHGLLTDYGHYVEVREAVAGIEAADVAVIGPAILALGLAVAGAALAWWLYRGPEPEPHTDKLGAFKELAINNYYQDEFQVWLAEGVTMPVARAANTFDQTVIDGAVDAVSSVSLLSGRRVRRIQSGIVSNYVALLAAALVVLLLFFGFAGGWF